MKSKTYSRLTPKGRIPSRPNSITEIKGRWYRVQNLQSSMLTRRPWTLYIQGVDDHVLFSPLYVATDCRGRTWVQGFSSPTLEDKTDLLGAYLSCADTTVSLWTYWTQDQIQRNISGSPMKEYCLQLFVRLKDDPTKIIVGVLENKHNLTICDAIARGAPAAHPCVSATVQRPCI